MVLDRVPPYREIMTESRPTKVHWKEGQTQFKLNTYVNEHEGYCLLSPNTILAWIDSPIGKRIQRPRENGAGDSTMDQSKCPSRT